MPMQNMLVSIKAADDFLFEAHLDENMSEGHITPGYYHLLHEVVERGTLGMLRALVARGFDPTRPLLSPHSCYDTGWTGDWGNGLHYAGFLGREEVCRYLLQAGCDPNGRDDDGATPLIATFWEQHTNIAELLLEHGADINAQDNSGNTALSWSAEDDRSVMLPWLLARGADPNCHATGSESPLRRAARQGEWELAAALSRYGARRDFYTAVLLGETERVEADLAASADPRQLATTPDSHGTTPLRAAIRWKHTAVADLLRSYGA